MSDLILAQLPLIRAEIYLACAAMMLLMYGAYAAPKADSRLVLVSVLVMGLSGYLVLDNGDISATILNGMFVTNSYTVAVKLLILVSSALALLLGAGWLKEEGGRPFEYVVLVLIATLGMMLMVSSANLLALYMSLEMMSLSLYVLASFDRDHPRSAEAGLKYFVLGSLASGMILFGASLIYGFAGTISFAGLADLFASQPQISQIVVVGLILVVVGFCFKLSAAPFHMWAPDVYEGAPTPVTAFFATAPKVAAFTLFARLLYEPFMALHDQWQQVLVAAALLSMMVGALAAIMQSNIKRLLAYSSIGHVGFVMMAIASGSQAGVQAMLVYMFVYVFMSVAMFGCVLMMGREDINSFAGLSKTHPLFAASIAALMFSMAGIPPLAGFFGKMVAILAAVNAGLFWVAVIAVITSVVSCYYYIKIVKLMYFDEPQEVQPLAADRLVMAATTIGVIVTVGFFLLPSPVMNISAQAAKMLVP